jgi:hypothetical protein
MHKHYENEGVTVVYDDQEGFLCVTYREVLTPVIAHQSFDWVREILEAYGPENVHSCLFDYRQVREFGEESLAQTRQDSRALFESFDLAHMPMGVLVKNMYQEQMTQAVIKSAHIEDRTQIVRSAKSAFEFFDHWKHEASPESL